MRPFSIIVKSLVLASAMPSKGMKPVTTVGPVDAQRDGTNKSLLDNAKEARRQRYQSGSMGKMEKATKVKMEYIVNHGRSMYSIFKKKERDASPVDGSAKLGFPNSNSSSGSKPGKSGSSGKSGKSGSSENQCVVRLTNLTKEQWFSDIFWMVHSDQVKRPLWSYGSPASSDLASLAQDGDADDLIKFYEDNDDGVLDVDSERGPIQEGESISFDIPKSGSYDSFTMATSFIFSNDGFVSIDAGEIKDGATWFLWGLDAGVEANSQLCWTVQATADEFPLNSECLDLREDIADKNDNSFPGEGFVHVHNGIHDFQDKGDLNDFLDFTCDDLDADTFVEYFSALGYDDDELLYDDDKGENERDNESFLDYVEDEDDFYGDIAVFQIAVDAGNFKKFCDDIDDINNFVNSTFATLEPQIFDFRTPMLRVQMAC